MQSFQCQHFQDILPPMPDVIVYKDECTQCCTTSENDKGVEVCLKCFNCGCIENSHGDSHFKITGHLPMARIFKTVGKSAKKPADKEDSVTELLSQDKTSYDFKFYCYECKAFLGKIDDKLQKVKDRITKSTDPADILLSKALSYQGHRQCPHSLELSQASRISSKPLAEKILLAFRGLSNPEELNKHESTVEENKIKCAECDLEKSIWFCLSCGRLSCGRKNFDGSGGNGHGLAHFSESAHLLAVKVGTVSPSGDGDVFCYGCDDTVDNAFLLKQLKFFGIKKLGRSEKKTAERELEMNRNHDWKEDGSDTAKVPVWGKGFRGIKNDGNNCYFIAVIQVLMSLTSFYQRYLEEGTKHTNTCRSRFPSNCFECQMAKIAAGIQKGKNMVIGTEEVEKLKKKRKEISISMLKSLVGRNSLEFMSNKQQDAFEFFVFLISELEKREKQKNPAEVFNFKIAYELQCDSCGFLRVMAEPASFLSIPFIKGEKDLLGLIDNFGCEQVISGVKCDKCDKTCDLKRKTRILNFPRILVVQISRVSFENGALVKNDDEVEVSETLNLSHLKCDKEADIPTKKVAADPGSLSALEAMGISSEVATRALIEKENSLEAALDFALSGACVEEKLASKKIKSAVLNGKFELFAFITHTGKSMDHGHYTSKVKKYGKWVCFDDSNVFEVDSSKAGSAYLLFFKNVDLGEGAGFL